MPADADLDDQPVVRHLSWEYFKDLYERERELREAEVDALKAEIRHERELREQRMDMNAAELSLQAKEYERRLDDLNHAHNQARETLATYLTREKFEQYAQGMDARLNDRSSQVDARFVRITTTLDELGRDVLSTYLPREKFEQYVNTDESRLHERMKELDIWRGRVSTALDEQRGAQQQTARLMAAGLFVVAVLSFILPRLIR